jgi:NAD(P)-dependent dehydrogenase (short-subunit alcohol dehydrogenase family)
MSTHALPGKVALIAGGGKNLGGLLSRALAVGGAKVVVHFNSDASRAESEQTVADIIRNGGEAIAVQGDLTQVAQVVALYDAARKRFGRIDIAVNTAGMVIKRPFIEIPESDYDRSFAVNSKAAFFFMQEAGRKLADGGKVCTILSSLLGAYTGLYSIYAGSKAAVEHFTRAAAREFGPRGISVTAVAPGPMETPFFYGQETSDSARYHQTAADLSRFTKTGLTDPLDIVALVRFLVTDGWWITGQTILANGGYTTK